MRLLFLFTAASIALGQLYSQTIAEKKAGIGASREDLTGEMRTFLKQINSDVTELQSELQRIYGEVEKLYKRQAPEEEYIPFLTKANEIRERIRYLQTQWQQMAASNTKEAEYALWNQPDTTIGQLVNDFGSHSFLYVAPPDISAMRISLDSNLPIPRSSWDEILEILLRQSGIGIRQLNPYLRELFYLDEDLSSIRIITAKREDLQFIPPNERIIFVLFPDPAEVKRVWFFLEKFTNSNTTSLQMVGRDILLVGRVAEIQDLMKIYDFVSTHRGDKEYKAIRVHKIDVVEMAQVLSALFESITDESIDSAPTAFPSQAKESDRRGPQEPPSRPDGRAARTAQQTHGNSSLRVIALQNIAQAIFLVGTKEEIRKAEEIVAQVEAQIGETRRKKIVWYHVKNSDPEELAQVLVKIYDLMVTTGAGSELEEPPLSPMAVREEQMQRNAQVRNEVAEAVASLPRLPPVGLVSESGFLSSANFLNNPENIRPPRQPPNQGRDNFLVDPKTGSLVMVIEADLVAEMTNLLKKLDVPKKMVQIEVMLVEQVIHHNSEIGLDLLKIGNCASNCNGTCFTFNEIPNPNTPPGITDFIINRARDGGIPAFDLTYHFLLSRDDIRVSAAPSVLTMNQTEATIKFEEEISVSVGTIIVPNTGNSTVEQSYARGNYGISIDVIPTVHMHDSDCSYDDGVDYITLNSDIKFETIVSNVQNRPDVIRRLLRNEARIADGQTVIIGGFRRKDTTDQVVSIPFLGEIPGFGKLFSFTHLDDRTIETFLILTAKIVSDPLEDLETLKMAEMARRPGDLPYFMKALRDSIESQQNAYLYQTMEILFGREPDRFVDKEACEYNGR